MLGAPLAVDIKGPGVPREAKAPGGRVPLARGCAGVPASLLEGSIWAFGSPPVVSPGAGRQVCGGWLVKDSDNRETISEQ